MYLLHRRSERRGATDSLTKDTTSADDGAYPDWFAGFLADRAIRKPSPHTAKAYRQDFTAIATLLGG
jgi:hypothetical protein